MGSSEAQGTEQGTYEPPVAEGRLVVFAYRGLDGRRRQSRIELGSDPDRSEVVGDLVRCSFHLTLGPYQRFASKGGYLVHYASTGAQRLVPDGEWMTP